MFFKSLSISNPMSHQLSALMMELPGLLRDILNRGLLSFWRGLAVFGMMLFVPVLMAADTEPSKTARPNSPSGQRALAMTQDFGTVDVGATAKLTYSVKNPTEKSIRILDMRTSCGCVNVPKIPKEIPARSNVEIEVEIDTAATRGRLSQTVIFKIEHPDWDLVRLQATGVCRGAWAHPAHVELGTVVTGRLQQRDFFVIEASLPDTKLVSLKVVPPVFTARIEQGEMDAAGRGQGLRALGKVIVSSDGLELPPGLQRAEILIQTNHKDFPEIKVPVAAHIMGPVELVPAPVVFGRVSPGERVRRTCRLQPLPDADVNLSKLNFVADMPDLSCVIKSNKTRPEVFELEMVYNVPRDTPESGTQRGIIRGVRDDHTIVSIPYVVMHTAKQQSGTASNQLPR